MDAPYPRHDTMKEVLGAEDIAQSLTRIAFEIVEKNRGGDLVIAGIPTGGAHLAQRLVDKLQTMPHVRAQYAAIDTTMFRDDLANHPLRAPKDTHVPTEGIEGRTVLLVDDVLYTGRTVKAALDALGSLGACPFTSTRCPCRPRAS